MTGATAPDDALDGAVDAALVRLAAVGRLLVACDFDGVLAPLVDDPNRSAPLPAAVAALRTLAGRPETVVALLSGRQLADLTRLSGLTAPVRFIGSHGAEWGVGATPALDSGRAARLAGLTAGFDAIASRYDGVWVEHKPVSAVLHVRTAAPADAVHAVADGERLVAVWPDVNVIRGKSVLDVSVLATDKGSALAALRADTGAEAVFFAGDDVTDEFALRRLGSGDLGLKVGPGDTAAAYRVGTPQDVAAVLTRLAHLRP